MTALTFYSVNLFSISISFLLCFLLYIYIYNYKHTYNLYTCKKIMYLYGINIIFYFMTAFELV